MAIPNYEQIMTPFLTYIDDAKEHKLADIKEKLADFYKLTEEEKAASYPISNNLVFGNRVQWARLYLLKARLIESPNRGVVCITPRGKKVLQQNTEVNLRVLQQFPEYQEFKKAPSMSDKIPVKSGAIIADEKTPDDIIEETYQTYRQIIAKDLLAQVKTTSPQFFEKLVIKLLVKMGYGGSLKEASANVTPATRDGGIDGVIKEDLLGLDVIYVQAKRWENNVSSPIMQQFIGAVKSKGANKGIIITTSDFSTEAYRCLEKLDCKIIPINGEHLAEYMIDYDIGVSQGNTYILKKVDMDFFDEQST